MGSETPAGSCAAVHKINGPTLGASLSLTAAGICHPHPLPPSETLCEASVSSCFLGFPLSVCPSGNTVGRHVTPCFPGPPPLPVPPWGLTDDHGTNYPSMGLLSETHQPEEVESPDTIWRTWCYMKQKGK